MRIAIVEDLVADREVLCSHIAAYFGQDCLPEAYQLEVFENGEAFLDRFPEHTYDLIFLDCYIGEITGLEVAQKIRSIDEHAAIIFTTHTRDFAIEGYKFKAAGYLLKPISYSSFTDILNMINFSQLHARHFILLENGNENSKIFLQDIIYCDIDKHYTQIHTISAGMYRFRMPFTRILEKLSPYREFYLCYRGCMINLEQVKKIDDLVLHMSNGERIPFRKREYHKLLRLHRDFLFEKVREQL